MTALRAAIDHTMLGWVKPELDELLRQMRLEVEAFAEQPADPAPMQFCVQGMQQVRGSLQMLDLQASALLAEEMRALAQALVDGKVEARAVNGACATLLRSMVLLPDYLERLQGGHRDVPIALLPLIDDVRAAHGKPGQSPEVLEAMNGAVPPSASELAHAQASLSGRNRALLDTVTGALKDDLLQIKDALDLQLRALEPQAQELVPQVAALGRVADTLRLLGLDNTAEAVRQQRKALEAVVSAGGDASEDALLGIAGALLYVDATLDDQVARLGGDERPSGVDSREISFLQAAQMALQEAAANLAQVREQLVAYTESNWDCECLANAPTLLHEAGGALRLLDHVEAGVLLNALEAYVARELLEARKLPDAVALDRIADILTSLDMYRDAAALQRVRREDLLDIARSSLAMLGYWPLQEAVGAAQPLSSDQAGAEAEQDTAPERAPARAEAPSAEAATDPDRAVGSGAIAAPVADVTAEVASGIAAAAAAVPGPAIVRGAQGFDNAGDDIDDEIREVFLEEFDEEIANLETLLPVWYQAPDDLERLRPIRRVFHTLKGSGRLVGARVLGEFSWNIESMLNRVLDPDVRRAPSAAVQAMVEQARLALPQLRDALRSGTAITADIAAIEQTAARVAAGEEVLFQAADASTSEARTSPVEAAAAVEVRAGAADDGGVPASVDAVLLEILDAEVGGHLQTIEEWLAATVASAQASDALKRALHTCNGAFAMADVPVITDVLTPAEGYVKRLLDEARPASPEGIAAIAEAAAQIRATLQALQTPHPRLYPQPELVARLRELRDTPYRNEGEIVGEAAPSDTQAQPGNDVEAAEAQRVAQLRQREHEDMLRLEIERLAAQRSEAERGEAERQEAARREAERQEAERQEAARREAERQEAARREAARREAERQEAERQEAARREAERQEAARREAARREAERQEADRQYAARIDALCLKAERLYFEEAQARRVEVEREEAARREAERQEAERREAARREAERREAERREAERREAERREAERREAERREAERREAERREAERREAERREAERREAERREAARREAERQEAERREAARREAERQEAERREAARREAERQEAARREAERQEAARREAERQEAERREAARREAERQEAERREAARREAERQEAERREAARREAERQEAERQEAARREAERQEAERREAERIAALVAAATAVQSGGSEDPDEALDLTDLDPELIALFVEEAGDLLDHSDMLLARLRESPQEHELVTALQRDLHTLKGGARMAGMMAIGELAHVMESLLERVANRRGTLADADLPLLERGFDRLHAMVTRVGGGRAIGLPSSLIVEFDARARGADVAAAIAAAAAPADETAVQQVAASVAPAAASSAQRLPAPLLVEHDDDIAVRAPQEQVRIRADLLDRLVNAAGEVAIYRARLEQQLGAFRAATQEMARTNTRLRDQLRRLDSETEAQIVARYQREQDTGDRSFDPLELDRFSTLQQLSRGLAESAADLVSLQGSLEDLTRQYESLLTQQSRVSTDLQEGLMRTRMVPFDAVLPRLRRVVRLAVTDTGKQAQLVLDGAHGELDRSVMERMTAPLEHLLRNAVAHGLEAPDARIRAGKPAEGQVRIALRREGSEVVLEVGDDGSGIDRAAVRKRALERGLIRADGELADAQLDALILQAGFSTVDEVSRLAGRGVGLDVVASEVAQLGGTLDIRSEPGHGSVFTLRLPQTMAVTQAVFVKVGDASFAVPVGSVRGVGRIGRAELDQGGATHMYGEERYPVYDLARLLGVPAGRTDNQVQVPLLLIRAGDLRAAVSVDQVIGNREIVVKPVGPQLTSIPGIFGATILGDGSVVVILDVAPLVRRQLNAPPSVSSPPLPVATARKIPLVMVVDDSITMRKVSGRVLERHGYDVITAKDGVDALERMEERIPDLMLLDIEMPRMDGYELATQMRAEPRLRDIPIIMITSRTGEKHRQRAFEIGVQRYLGKPYQEHELMRNVEQVLGVETPGPGREAQG